MRAARRAAAAVLAGAALAAACASPAPSPNGGAAGEERLSGVLAVVGSAPVDTHLSLRTDDGRNVFVTGPMEAELRRLSGARVEVRGRPGGERGAFRAEGYEIRSVDGRPVETGTVERAPSGGLQLRTTRGETILLTGGVTTLRPGQKVWVQGPRSLQVQVHAVIVP